MRVTSNTDNGVCIDAASGVSTHPGPNVYDINIGSRITGSTQPSRLSGWGSLSWIQSQLTLKLKGSPLPQNSRIYQCIGFNPNQFGGLPLPLALPGTGTSPSGTCTIHHGSPFQIPQITNISGRVSGELPFGVNLSLHGANIHPSNNRVGRKCQAPLFRHRYSTFFRGVNAALW